MTIPRQQNVHTWLAVPLLFLFSTWADGQPRVGTTSSLERELARYFQIENTRGSIDSNQVILDPLDPDRRFASAPLGAILLAEQVDLSKHRRHLSERDGLTIVLVDTIRLRGEVKLPSGFFRRTILIVARQLIVDEGATLTIEQRTMGGPERWHIMANTLLVNGNTVDARKWRQILKPYKGLRVAEESPFNASGDYFVITPATADSITKQVYSYIQLKMVPVEIPAIGAARARVGAEFIREGRAKQISELVRQKWLLWRLHLLQLNLLEVTRLPDGKKAKRVSELLALFREIPAVKGPGEGEYMAHLDAMRKLTREIVPGVWHHSLEVAVDGLPPQAIDVFTDPRTLASRIAPTHLVIRVNRTGGKDSLGTLHFDRSAPEELYLFVDCDLVVDARVMQLAKKELLKRGFGLASGFPDWMLKGQEVRLGPSSTLNALCFGRSVRVEVRTTPGELTLVLAQLLSRNGLPLRLEWYSRDSKAKGVLPTMSVSLDRLAGNLVKIDGSKVANTASFPVVINHVRVGNRHVRMEPALSVDGGGTAKLLIPYKKTDGNAIATGVGIGNVGVKELMTHLYVAYADDAIRWVSVENSLPLQADKLGGQFHYVEINILYGNSKERKIVAGPYRLGPWKSDTSKIRIPFVKIKGNGEGVLVRGIAVYGDGQREHGKHKFEIQCNQAKIALTESSVLPKKK